MARRAGFVLEEDLVPGLPASLHLVDYPVAIDDDPNVFRLQHAQYPRALLDNCRALTGNPHARSERGPHAGSGGKE